MTGKTLDMIEVSMKFVKSYRNCSKVRILPEPSPLLDE
jgi:hypothetical protein